MTDFVHTLAYASVIRNSVTGLLQINELGNKQKHLYFKNKEFNLKQELNKKRVTAIC